MTFFSKPHSTTSQPVSDIRTPAELRHLALETGLDDLCALARNERDAGFGPLVSYSRKVFIPLTKLCRDVCHYCTFAIPPKRGEKAFLTIDEALDIARQGKAVGCKEALFTLGDKPELRYAAARRELAELGFETTIAYLAEVTRVVFEETGLLPHLNPGLLSPDDLQVLRRVSVSQGIMLETIADRLSERGQPHWGSPDKEPAKRLETIRNAGVASVPFTTGLLIGIGETREERLDALFELRRLHEEFGHIQEIIIQNFRPKDGTRMAGVQSPSLDEHRWTIAMARMIFGPAMSIQAPPNLSPGALHSLIDAGINDWGGVSPVTPDHVNPEAPWPHLDRLASETAKAGKQLVQRLAVYPAFIADMKRWTDPAFHPSILKAVEGDGFARTDAWFSGSRNDAPQNDLDLIARRSSVHTPVIAHGSIGRILHQIEAEGTVTGADIAVLFSARGQDFTAICALADTMRHDIVGDAVSYVVTRNINYTNICTYKCQFCAFSKGKTTEELRGKPYNLPVEEVEARVHEAWSRGASEVCMQGGIHPSYTGDTYLRILRAVKQAEPDIHVHAFSPLEVAQGAKTLGISVEDYLRTLKAAGLGSLPGTAAEILDDEVRDIICPDKLGTDEWLDVVGTAHRIGLKTTSTIMFGHVDNYRHWARHLLRLRDLQLATGGITEFVPLPFVHMEAPIFRKGRARMGPSFREVILMHAIARLVFGSLIPNIQTSWVKLGAEGAAACLNAGANDLGGTLMNETISRSAGADHGQEMTPEHMESLISGIGRIPRQRTTLYGDAAPQQRLTSFNCSELRPVENTLTSFS